MEDRMVGMLLDQSLFTSKTRITWIQIKVWHLTKPRIDSINKTRCSKCWIRTTYRFLTQLKINSIMATKTPIMFKDPRLPIWTIKRKVRSSREVYLTTLPTESSSKWTKKLLNKMHLVQAKQTQDKHPSIKRWWPSATNSQVSIPVTIMEWILKLKLTNHLPKFKANTLPLLL